MIIAIDDVIIDNNNDTDKNDNRNCKNIRIKMKVMIKYIWLKDDDNLMEEYLTSWVISCIIDCCGVGVDRFSFKTLMIMVDEYDNIVFLQHGMMLEWPLLKILIDYDNEDSVHITMQKTKNVAELKTNQNINASSFASDFLAISQCK